jgi:hypothetical protein
MGKENEPFTVIVPYMENLLASRYNNIHRQNKTGRRK